MREILFRGKQKNGGEWVEGFLVPVTVNCYDKGYEIISTSGIEYDELDYYNPTFEADRVVPETIGQYTGLTDKNGKRIFEGDIVKIDDKYIRYVVYSGVSTSFVKLRYISRLMSEGSTTLGYGYDSHKHTIEVIGNVHDNPEILEVNE